MRNTDTSDTSDIFTDKSQEKHAFLSLFVAKRLINGAAGAMTGIFLPIFLYETSGEDLFVVAGFYALTYILYVFLVVPSMSILNRVGFSRSLVIAGVFNVAYIYLMYSLNGENLLQLLAPLGITLVLFRLFHWVPFQVDFTLFTKLGERGQMVGLSSATIAFLGIIGPVLAGFIIAQAGYQSLFAVVLVIAVMGTIAYAFVPETKTRFDWTYGHTWQQLFAKENRGMLGGEVANGIEGGVSLIIWPIFLFEILDGDVFEIGAVTTVVVAITILLQLLLGRHIDTHKQAKVQTLKVGSFFYAIGWIFKMFVLSASHVFFVGLYHNLASIFTRTPFAALIYDMCGDKGGYADEYTVLREIAIHTGRFISLIAVMLLTIVLPLEWSFILAALASIALNMVYRNRV